MIDWLTKNSPIVAGLLTALLAVGRGVYTLLEKWMRRRREMRDLELANQRDDQLRAFHAVANERDRLLEVIAAKEQENAALRRENTDLRDQLLETTRELAQTTHAIDEVTARLRAGSRSPTPSPRRPPAGAPLPAPDPTSRLPRPPSPPRLRRP